jgi:hypothetical protein
MRLGFIGFWGLIVLFYLQMTGAAPPSLPLMGEKGAGGSEGEPAHPGQVIFGVIRQVVSAAADHPLSHVSRLAYGKQASYWKVRPLTEATACLWVLL